MCCLCTSEANRELAFRHYNFTLLVGKVLLQSSNRINNLDTHTHPKKTKMKEKKESCCLNHFSVLSPIEISQLHLSLVRQGKCQIFKVLYMVTRKKEMKGEGKKERTCRQVVKELCMQA